MTDPVDDVLTEALGPNHHFERELLGGGMSRVLLVRDDDLGRMIVVKMLSPELAASLSIERFRREVLVAAGLQHPNIVPVLSAGVVRGTPYFIMPYVDGESLATRLGHGPEPTSREIVTIMRDVARALSFAHERGIVHRDIKPGNVLVAGGAAVVTDFGIAKALSSALLERPGHSPSMTATGTSLGTLPYMSPEQALGDTNIDARADIYSLGATAYEMMAGRPPFADLSPRGMLAARINDEPPPFPEGKYPPALIAIVRKCLAADPDHRQQSAKALLDELETMPADGGAPRKRSARRSRGWMIALALAVVAAGGAGWKMRQSASSRRAISPSGAASLSDLREQNGVLAILPFTNAGTDPGDTYLATGITNTVASTLVRAAHLRVASPSASIQHDAAPIDVARRLNATMFLEGAVMRRGDRVQVTARLTRVSDGTIAWSDSYDHQSKDLFATQDSLAAAIVAAVTHSDAQVAARVVENTPGTHALPPNVYDAYLRGQYDLARRGEAALLKSIAEFTDVTRAAPKFSAGWSGLSEAYSMLPLYATSTSDSVRALALAAAENAIRTDPSSPHAHASRALALDAYWRWSDAEAEFQRALDLAPRDPMIHEWYGEQLLVRGKLAPAVIHLTRAARLDPTSAIIEASLAVALGRAGLSTAALQAADSAVRLDPSLPAIRFMRGAVLVYAGAYEDSYRDFERAILLDSTSTNAIGFSGYAHAMAGDKSGARAALAKVQKMPELAGRDVAIARVSIALGDTTRALDALDRAVSRHDPFFQTESLNAPPFSLLAGNDRYRQMSVTAGLDSSRAVRR